MTRYLAVWDKGCKMCDDKDSADRHLKFLANLSPLTVIVGVKEWNGAEWVLIVDEPAPTADTHPAAISPLDRLAWLASADWYEERGDVVNANDCRNVADGLCNPGPYGLDRFTTSYLECALWLLQDDGHDDGTASIRDLSWETIRDAVIDCIGFQSGDGIGEMIDGDMEQAGHDFFLTRNGHGAGFWDGDWPEGGVALTRWAKTFGTWELSRADDGTIYSHS